MVRHALPSWHRVVAVAVLSTVVFVGCTVREYVVTRDETPLYATPAADRVIERMPLGHHEVIDGDDDEKGLLKVRFRGLTGFAKRDDVKLFHYVSPELDGGSDREETVGREVRAVAVAHAGASWSQEVRDAVRDGRVLDGMSREQVELAWGWPRTIEALANPVGGERWVYRRRGYETIGEGGERVDNFRPIGGTSNGWSHGVSYGRQGYLRLPVTEERVVEFDPAAKVTRSYVRRYYEASTEVN